jgi:hypothetical protein
MTMISNFKLGGAMHFLGAHYSVAKILLSNPELAGNEVKVYLKGKSTPTTSLVHIKGL